MFDAISIMDDLWIQAFMSTTDIDWIMGQGTSTCPEPPSFTFTPATSFTTGTSDLIGTLTLETGTATDLQGNGFCPYDEFVLFLHHSDGNIDYSTCNDGSGNSVELSFTSSGSPTDTWTVSENGFDLCNDANLDCTNMAAAFRIAENEENQYCWDAATQSNYLSACEF